VERAAVERAAAERAVAERAAIAREQARDEHLLLQREAAKRTEEKKRAEQQFRELRRQQRIDRKIKMSELLVELKRLRVEEARASQKPVTLLRVLPVRVYRS